MAVTSTPIFAQTPYAKSLTLAAQTACTTRAPTATANLAAANIVAFVPISTNGLRIDSIQVNNVGTGISTANAAAAITTPPRIFLVLGLFSPNFAGFLPPRAFDCERPKLGSVMRSRTLDITGIRVFASR